MSFLSLSSLAMASELLDGWVISIDKPGKRITVRDSETGQDRVVSIDSAKDVAAIGPGSHIRIWMSSQADGGMRANRISARHPHDMTGIKKRLRKAIGLRGKGFHGHRGRGGRGHGHGR